MRYDWEYVYMLLCVVEKGAQHPKLKNITSAALAELDVIANPPTLIEEKQEEWVEPNEPPIGDASNGRRV